MTISVTSTVKADIPYTAVETQGVYNNNETASLGHTLNLIYGTGTGMINAGVLHSGFLPAYGEVYIDFNKFPKTLFESTSYVSFTGGDVKGVVVQNKFKNTNRAGGGIANLQESADINVRATGDIGGAGQWAFTGLFNGETGNVRITPNATWMFLDPQGIIPFVGSSGITIKDMNGSGCPFSVIAVGVTGNGIYCPPYCP